MGRLAGGRARCGGGAGDGVHPTAHDHAARRRAGGSNAAAPAGHLDRRLPRGLSGSWADAESRRPGPDGGARESDAPGVSLGDQPQPLHPDDRPIRTITGSSTTSSSIPPCRVRRSAVRTETRSTATRAGGGSGTPLWVTAAGRAGSQDGGLRLAGAGRRRRIHGVKSTYLAPPLKARGFALLKRAGRRRSPAWVDLPPDQRPPPSSACTSIPAPAGTSVRPR